MIRIALTKFTRPALAAALGLSLALSPVATAPSRADDVDQALAALLALGIIGLAITSNNSASAHSGNSGSQGNHGGYGQPGWHGDNNRKLLPAQCLRDFRTPRGTKTFFGSRCLEANYRQAHKLPDRCELTIRTRNAHGHWDRREVFSPQCLRDAGYRVARRH